jgi:DNA-binding IclR family transcriptional regulator
MNRSDPAETGGLSSSVKSATRVLSIFEYFEKTKSPRTLSEISQDLEFPVSSTLALLRSVQAMGYLNYDQRDKTYAPSIRLAVLGQWIHDKFFAGSSIAEMMEHLAARTEESVLLAVQNGLQVQHIRVIHTSQLLSYAPPVGTLRPLLRSAGGRALLSQQSDDVIKQTVERINALRLDEGRVFDAAEVLADVQNIRKAGFAFSSNLFVKGAAMIAVPLPLQTTNTPMVICVAGPTSRIDESAIPTLLKQVRGAIAKFL